jgi:hypothetical protein
MEGSRAPRCDIVDPRETREELNAILLGHQTHLTTKVRGENSMSGKVETDENRLAFCLKEGEDSKH